MCSLLKGTTTELVVVTARFRCVAGICMQHSGSVSELACCACLRVVQTAGSQVLPWNKLVCPKRERVVNISKSAGKTVPVNCGPYET